MARGKLACRVPSAPTGLAYHLWLTAGGETKLAGIMALNEEGFGFLIYEAGEVGPKSDLATLTLQPLGADQPRGEPYLVWRQE